jgi:hypothetical protein
MKTLFWVPRIFAILFIILISSFALDVLGPNFSWLALLLRLLPSLISLVVLLIAWKWEAIGGLLFMVAGLIYIIMFWGKVPWSGYLVIAGPALLIGILFLVARFYNQKDEITNEQISNQL